MIGISAPSFKLEHCPITVFEYGCLRIGSFLRRLITAIGFYSAIHHDPGSPSFQWTLLLM